MTPSTDDIDVIFAEIGEGKGGRLIDEIACGALNPNLANHKSVRPGQIPILAMRMAENPCTTPPAVPIKILLA